MCNRWNVHDVLHDWRAVVPIRPDAVEHDLGLSDGSLDGARVEYVEFEYSDRVVDG